MSRLVTLMVSVALVMQLTSWSHVAGVENMLTNPGFEEEDLGKWFDKGQTKDLVRTDTDQLDGSYSLLSSGRRGENSGPARILEGIQMGRGYRFSAYVKILGDKPGKLWQELKAVVSFNATFADESMRDPDAVDGDLVSYIIAFRAFVTSQQQWVHLTGDLNALMIPFTSVRLSIQGPDPEIDFLVDNVTFFEVAERPNWLSESHVMIDKNRKSDVTFRVFVPQNVEPHSVDVQVRLKKHLFPFGCKLEDMVTRRKNLTGYLDLFLNLFNWATIPNFSWWLDKGPTLYEPDYSNQVAAVDKAIEKGLKVRATSVVRTVSKNIPKRVLETPPEKLPDLLKFRAEYMMNVTNGKIEVWDVINEYLHGKWFEEATQDPTLMEKLFKWAHAADPNVKLAFNDFQGINAGGNTEEMHDVAKRFIKAETSIKAIGVQGHAKPYTKPDPKMIWSRLDRLADTGLEVYLTEYDVGWYDDVTRADWFEDGLRAYFAHPAMTGVTLWGIWKEMQRYPNQYLIYGPDMKFAEGGERFVCLTQKEWTTDETFNLAAGTDFTMRGFQGDYEVIVRKYKVPMQRETFTLGKDPMEFYFEVTEDSSSILEDNKYDYVPKCISHRDRKSLGKLASTATNSDIACSNHVEETTGSVTCPEGMVMTSCSSFRDVSGSLQWTGEAMTLVNGVVTCVIVKGNNSPQGAVKVSARCCGAKDLECDYRQAGPSSPFNGAMAEAICPANHIAMGCTASNRNSHLKGAFTSPDMTSCLAQNGASLSSDPALLTGVISGTACCSKPSGLTCHRVNQTAQATCPDGEVMTGCNVEAENGSDAGAHIEDESDGTTYCKVEMAGEVKVQAVAICCTP